MWFQHGEDDLSDITYVAKSVGSFVFSSVISSLPSCVRYPASDLNITGLDKLALEVGC